MTTETAETKRRIEKFSKAIDVLERISSRRKDHPTTRTEQAYYDVFIRAFKQARDAADHGHPFVLVTGEFPWEVLQALNIHWLGMVPISGAIAKLMNIHHEASTKASSMGLRVENCSICRTMAGSYGDEWFPKPDAIICNCVSQCDNISNLGHLLGQQGRVPHFYLDASYFPTQKGRDYLESQLGEMVVWLEELFQVKTDWDRFEDIFKVSEKQYQLSKEIDRLCKEDPAPARNRYLNEYHWVQLETTGNEDGVFFMETLRDELKERLATLRSSGAKERFRICDYLFPPHQLKVADWMEEQHGAVMVSSTPALNWGEIEFDARKPLRTIAQKYFAEPIVRAYGPYLGRDGAREMMLRDVQEGRADAALFIYNRTCTFQSSMQRALAEYLNEKAGIPSLSVAIDVMDMKPSASDDLIQKLDQFLKVAANIKNGVRSRS